MNFKKMLLAFFLVFALSSSAYAWTWTKADTAREIVGETLITVDWGTTRDIAANVKRFKEDNPLMGSSRPSPGRVDTHCIAWLIIHPVISAILPEKYREIWQYATIGAEAASVGHNYYIGLHMHW